MDINDINCRFSPGPFAISKVSVVILALSLGGCAFSLGSANTGLESGNSSKGHDLSESLITASTNHSYEKNEYSQTQNHPSILKAQQLTNSGKISQALAILKKAHKDDPDNKFLISALARTALKAGSVDMADKYIRKAGGFASNDWKIISAKGVLLSRRGDYNGARQHFQKALQLSPDQTSVLSNLALTYILDNKPGQAAKILRRAVQLEPDNQKAKQLLNLTKTIMATMATSRKPSIQLPANSQIALLNSENREMSQPRSQSSELEGPLVLRPSNQD